MRDTRGARLRHPGVLIAQARDTARDVVRPGASPAVEPPGDGETDAVRPWSDDDQRFHNEGHPGNDAWTRARAYQKRKNAVLITSGGNGQRAVHTVLGLVLIALLVPILQLFRGAGGTLGPSIPLVFLIPVLLTSTLGGRIAGVIVAVVAVSVWDWYFITPLYTVTVGSARDLLALLVFLAVALLTGHLATTARRQTEEAVLRARSAEALYDLSMGLIARTDVVDVLSALTERLRTTFDLQASAVLLPDDTGLTWQTAASAGTLPREARVEESRVVRGMAAWVNEHGRPSGQREERTHLLPLRVGSRAVGVLQLVYKHGSHLDAEREHLLETFANGAALALEQARHLASDGERVALVCYSRGLARFLERMTAEWPRQHRPAYVGLFHALPLQWGATPPPEVEDAVATSSYYEEQLPAQMGDLAACLP